MKIFIFLNQLNIKGEIKIELWSHVVKWERGRESEIERDLVQSNLRFEPRPLLFFNQLVGETADFLFDYIWLICIWIYTETRTASEHRIKNHSAHPLAWLGLACVIQISLSSTENLRFQRICICLWCTTIK